jgi:hypothetical protein
MSKKQGKKESGKATLAGVKKEMAKPRMAKFARKRTEPPRGSCKVNA